MLSNDIYVRRKRAGLNQRELLPNLPLLPSGSKITPEFLGRIERGEAEISQELYDGIIAAIDNMAALKAAAA